MKLRLNKKDWKINKSKEHTIYKFIPKNGLPENRLEIVTYEANDGNTYGWIEWYVGKGQYWDAGRQGGPIESVPEEWMELWFAYDGINKLIDGWRSRIGCKYMGNESLNDLIPKITEAFMQQKLPSKALDYPSDLWKGSLFLKDSYSQWMVAHSHRTFGVDYDKELYEKGIQELSSN